MPMPKPKKTEGQIRYEEVTRKSRPSPTWPEWEKLTAEVRAKWEDPAFRARLNSTSGNLRSGDPR